MTETALSRRLSALAAGRLRDVLLVAALAGVFAALGQAPFGLWPATLVGLALGVALIAAAPGVRRAAWAGWALGAGYFGLTLVWIVQPFLVDIARHGWMAPFALVLMAGGMALFWAGGAALGRWLMPARWSWLGFAAGLTLTEALRARLFSGFPWGGPGLVWIDTPVAQVASAIGAFGLSALTFAIVALLGLGLLRSRWWAPVLPGALVLALLWIGGGWALRAPLPERAEPVTLRILQPNARQDLKFDPDFAMDFVERQIGYTAAPPAEGGAAPDLVIWPETAVPMLLQYAESTLDRIVTAAGETPVVLGIQRNGGFGRYFNSMILLEQGTAPSAIYDKHHLVPFGEYIPLGNLAARLGIHGLAAQEGFGFTPGPGAGVMALPGALGDVLPLICYEAIFPRDLRDAPGRTDWILQITNDAWFGTFSGPQQHLVQARMRAVEFGQPLVRAANTGISAVIDPRGQVVEALPLGRAGFMDVALPASLPPTIYARIGDWPIIFLALILFSGFYVSARRERR